MQRPQHRHIIEPKEIRKGKCKCHFEPRGDHGLEGYSRDDCYPFQEMKDNKGKYYRVYPNSQDYPKYYECCGTKTFQKYFEIVILEI